MSLTLLPVMRCNMGCKGCYLGEVFRQNNNRPEPYDLDAMIRTCAAIPGDKVTMHGGEFTLLPLDDMRRLFEAMRQQKRQIAMQTNGSMITAKLIDLLVEYGVSVGISLNGPDALNRDRRSGSVVTGTAADAVTDKLTARIHQNIERLCERKVNVGIIVVLSQTNAGDDEKLERLIEWARDLGERLGVWDIRWNVLGQDDKDIEGDRELTEERAAQVYVRLAEATFQDGRRAWLPFREYVDNLFGFSVAPCWMSPCDVFNTEAVQGVAGDGSLSNCGRPAKEGIQFVRPERQDHVRQAILQQIPMAEGGCRDCRYWRVCHGGCPGEAVGGDWRNKSRFCGMYVAVYRYIEQRLVGLIPNFQGVPDWVTNDEADLLRTRQQGKPRTSAIRALDQKINERPSTWMSPHNLTGGIEPS